MKFCLFFLSLLFLFPFSSSAASMPPSWPWHGVSMDNLSSIPSDLLRYKQEVGLNVVRLQLKIAQYAKKRNVSEKVAWEESMGWLNHMLDRCEQLNIMVIVNVSSFIFNHNIRYNMHSIDFWKGKYTEQHILKSVNRIVLMLRSRGKELVAYDFISEPAIVDKGKSIAPEIWGTLINSIAQIVHKNDPERWLIISTPPWGMVTGYKSFQPLPYPNIIYGAHIYSPHRYTHQGVSDKDASYKYPGWVHGRFWDKDKLINSVSLLVKFQKQYNIPVLIGEFSTVRWAKGGEQYIKDLVSIFDELGWSWLYFSGTGWHGWNPDYNQHYPRKVRTWKADYVGDKSVRWQTLREIFGVKPVVTKP
jgi:hypothetical protein